MDPVLSTAIEYSEYRLLGKVTCTVPSCKKNNFFNKEVYQDGR